MATAEDVLTSPAEGATDDVLVLVFSALAEGFCSPDALTLPSHKLAAARFTWFRTTLPLVCQRWHRLVLETPALWSTCIINPAAEAQAARRSIRQQQQGEAAAGASPVRLAAANRFYDASDRSFSETSTPNRAASPVLGSSPDSDSGGYWSSQFAPYTGQHSIFQEKSAAVHWTQGLWCPQRSLHVLLMQMHGTGSSSFP